MLVVGSDATSKDHKVYHKMNCMYVKRIHPGNRLEMNRKQAERAGFCECKYCAGLQGEIRTQPKQIQYWENKHNMQLTYRANCNTLYIRTEIGFWKIYRVEENGKYVLYHLNSYRTDMSFHEASCGEYHRQADLKATDSLGKIVEYIAAHDKAKVIMMDDYRKLPQHSKKQKKYYKQAERKAKKKAVRRLDSIFAILEQQNPGFREVSFG